MQLSANFSLEELAVTNTGLDNTPDKREHEKLLYLANYILQPIRNQWGALKVTSGYRSPRVNIAVGGSQTSQHCFGEAADIVPDTDIEKVFEWIVRSKLPFGQCIREHKNGANWIHISLPRLKGTNQQALVYDGKEYRPYDM